MKNCVAYMRYSTDNQTENSIEYQRAAIADYCTRNDWTLLQEFVDEAYSATLIGTQLSSTTLAGFFEILPMLQNIRKG